MTNESRRLVLVTLSLATVLALTIAGGCVKPSTGPRTLFLAGQAEATVVESESKGLPRTVTRVVTYRSGVITTTTAVLDRSGTVLEATFRRAGAGGKKLEERTTKLVRAAMGPEFVAGAQRVAIRGLDERAPKIVLLEFLAHVSEPGPVVFVDLAAGEWVAGMIAIERGEIRAESPPRLALSVVNSRGARTGPGAFFEGTSSPPGPFHEIAPKVAGGSAPKIGDEVDLGVQMPPAVFALEGPGQTAHPTAPTPVSMVTRHVDKRVPRTEDRMPAPFFESDSAEVKAFAALHTGATKNGTGAQDALKLVEAVHQLVDTSGGGGPPSAIRTLARKAGDCDDATALLVAALRAAGHAARPVVGLRIANGTATPHAWAEVWSGDQWLSADAIWPGVGTFPSHVRLFDGLGSSLTVGRVLGTMAPVIRKSRSPSSPSSPTPDPR